MLFYSNDFNFWLCCWSPKDWTVRCIRTCSFKLRGSENLKCYSTVRSQAIQILSSFFVFVFFTESNFFRHIFSLFIFQRFHTIPILRNAFVMILTGSYITILNYISLRWKRWICSRDDNGQKRKHILIGMREILNNDQ